MEQGYGDKVAFHWVGNDPADKGQVGTPSQLNGVDAYDAYAVEFGGFIRKNTP